MTRIQIVLVRQDVEQGHTKSVDALPAQICRTLQGRIGAKHFYFSWNACSASQSENAKLCLYLKATKQQTLNRKNWNNNKRDTAKIPQVPGSNKPSGKKGKKRAVLSPAWIPPWQFCFGCVVVFHVDEDKKKDCSEMLKLSNCKQFIGCLSVKMEQEATRQVFDPILRAENSGHSRKICGITFWLCPCRHLVSVDVVLCVRVSSVNVGKDFSWIQCA